MAKCLVVGISGCSSSGKTTLARLLRDIFPNTFILHQDDFYKPETELPTKHGLLDWDCAEAINVPSMADALTYVHEHAVLPPTLESYQDQNSVGKCPVSDEFVADLKKQVDAALPASHPLRNGSLRLCVLDGFLLYPPSMAAVQPLLDVKLFVRASYARAKQRREARDGYATLEGFWADPPGYVDKIVWPNYVADHAWMFENRDVEGHFDAAALQQAGISVLVGDVVDANMDDLLKWTVSEVLEKVGA